MSLHARQPTLLRMVMDPSDSAPTTPTKSSTTSPSESPNRTELEPTPLLLALDMAAERKRLRSRKDSILTGAEDDYVEVGKEEEGVEERKMKIMEEDRGDGKEIIIPVKEDLSQLGLLGQSINNGFWHGVEGVKNGVWGLVGWA